jgi:hypothetical protein
MADPYRAFRRLERMVHISPEPPDDRKTLDDMRRYPRQTAPAGGRLIATIVYNLDTGETTVERAK